jgi:hypothetical protein
MDISHIDDTLRTYRRELPATSKTARAIDSGASLAEISECAEEEGLHHLASALFEAQQEELYDVIEYPTERMSLDALHKFRQDIPGTSKTARAIDRGASWEEISRLAEEEGLRRHQLGAVLLQAGQERLRRKD